MDVADQQIGRRQVRDAVGEECQRLFQVFLENCKNADDSVKYLEEARNLVKPERNTLKVSYEDVELANAPLATLITQDFYRVYPYMCLALRNFVKDHVDVNVPKKEFFIALTHVPSRVNIRELSTVKVGTLVRISGQVVRTHPVHPELVCGTFTCLDCNTVIKDVEQQFKYTQPTICTNNVCNNRTRFLLDTSRSRFVDFQKVRIQETQRELPRGAIPRSLEIIIRAELVESAQAGDKCDFTGSLIVVPDIGVLNLPGAKAETAARYRPEGMEAGGEGLQGLKSLGVRELNYKIAFLACDIVSSNPKYSGYEWNLEDITPESLRSHLNDNEWNKIFEMSNDRFLYKNLYHSLFPTIYGNDEIKRGILLMLFGGVPKKTGEGTTLRGDVNICIVGDPSTAKSQFLKQVTEFSPRSVYTSGKASSAAGLTAAVVRDEETFEFVIEAGALMLADNGICCIDEFDKMDKRDQVAIHEAMEQQTISITKAGVKATLNARTSILAAANPIEGRYNRAKSLKQNVGLSAPIMSRFDLFFVIIDEPNEITDYAVARKIVDLHSKDEEYVERIYTAEDILRYITFARQFKPKIGKEAARQIVTYYNHLRQRENVGGTATRITVRQLESMIRLAEALAKMSCSDIVTAENVQEAYRLLNASIIRVDQPDVHFGEEEHDVSMHELDEDENDENVIEIESEDYDMNPKLNDTKTSGAEDEDDQSQKKQKPVKESGGSNSKMTFQEYKAISTLIMFYLLREEKKQEAEGKLVGVHKSQIVEWYIQEIEHEITTEADLVHFKDLTEKVIDRIINVDNYMISLPARKGEVDDNPLILSHPNYKHEF